MKYSGPRFTVVLLGAALSLSSSHDAATQGIGGLWTGEDTNAEFSSQLSIRLTTNGYGAFYGAGPSMGIPGTFTYTLLQSRISYLTNDTPSLTGILRYDTSADVLIYQESAKVAEALRESRGPVLLLRDTNELHNAMLGSMIGATNYHDLMTRLGGFIDTLTNNVQAASERSDMLKRAQQGGAANGSRAIRSETNRTSSAAGSRR
jgi:hypothetical protein